MFPRVFSTLILALVAVQAATGQLHQESPAQEKPHPLTISGIGKGVAPVDGLWQFQIGDDPRWADPALDDSSWETIHADSYWGAQGHPSYAGYAWYRRHLDIVPTSGANDEYRLLIPNGEDAFEVYWNGVRMGSYGKLPPRPWWYYNIFPRSFPLRGSSNGVLAIRMWKAPLDAFSPAESGGLFLPPLVGDPDSIQLRESQILWGYVQGNLYDYSLVLLRTFIAILCVILWTRNRREQLFVWVGIFTIAPVGLDALQQLFLLPLTYAVARCINQPLYVVSNISLWFLLVWMLRLNGKQRVVHWTKTIAWLSLGAGLIDGLLAIFWANASLWMQWTDGILCGVLLIFGVLPLVLIGIGLRKTLDESRWAVALSAFILQAIHTIADASALGQRFTHFTLYGAVIDTPLFSIQGVDFQLERLTALALFAAILYAVYRYVLEQQARRTQLEQELQSAREIQQVLIPETLPALEGYGITSAYTPAQEVGGDFFQILANPGQATIVAIGDVSGKGLKAAMNVSMIVGVLRAQAATTESPSEILNALNHCLVGRMQGGFATAVVLRLETNGTVTFANAGHLPPFLNDSELALEPSLPLGLLTQADYSELAVRLRPGDRLSLYTDGLLEARNSTGELYGFDRMHSLFAGRPTAQQASEEAVQFGQDDDITVLILTRLAAGEEPTSSIVAPLLTATPAA
ncbi:MAG TPA: SpoIIE family protein phosphatase [Terracidiphilus sp.]|nr:SpoIIE family protein phosphatase [Terracidiphilus sp.]